MGQPNLQDAQCSFFIRFPILQSHDKSPPVKFAFTRRNHFSLFVEWSQTPCTCIDRHFRPSLLAKCCETSIQNSVRSVSRCWPQTVVSTEMCRDATNRQDNQATTGSVKQKYNWMSSHLSICVLVCLDRCVTRLSFQINNTDSPPSKRVCVNMCVCE